MKAYVSAYKSEIKEKAVKDGIKEVFYICTPADLEAAKKATGIKAVEVIDNPWYGFNPHTDLNGVMDKQPTKAQKAEAENKAKAETATKPAAKKAPVRRAKGGTAKRSAGGKG